jgi:hypothetical protein
MDAFAPEMQTGHAKERLTQISFDIPPLSLETCTHQCAEKWARLQAIHDPERDQVPPRLPPAPESFQGECRRCPPSYRRASPRRPSY